MKMEERKLTDEQVLKALEICGNDGNCRDCPYRINNIECCSSLEKDSLAIINSLQVENKRLSDKAIALEVETNNQQAEIERLKNETTYLQRVADAFKGDYKNAKADGAREIWDDCIDKIMRGCGDDKGFWVVEILIETFKKYGVEVDL